MTTHPSRNLTGNLGLSALLLLLLVNSASLAHLLLLAAVWWVPGISWTGRSACFVFLLYGMPPLLGRCLLLFIPEPRGSVPVGSRTFFFWWALFQLQMLYSRFPLLEELLRTIPGLYSLWLRLWGARIGGTTFWSPGTVITDRSFLNIGNHVIFGAGVRLNPHVLDKGKDGEFRLWLEPITVGDGTMVGGYSLLTAGTQIAAGETTHAFLISPPGSVWKNGKRVRSQRQPI